MSDGGKPEKRGRRPVEEIPVLTEVADAAEAAGIGANARADELVAEIERVVLEELTVRLEDAVHQAVRAAVDRALAEQQSKDKSR